MLLLIVVENYAAALGRKKNSEFNRINKVTKVCCVRDSPQKNNCLLKLLIFAPSLSLFTFIFCRLGMDN